MGQIKVLDQNMVNMIAAGEVIERPASVVKELMENSIDAGATKIAVNIEDGGRKLISVSDNGCGMDGEDLASAFESHTTSKIKTSNDLRAISTLGFRGEALASIASVAQVRATSQAKDSSAANCLEIDCGNKGAVSPCSADYGTTIQVRDLFYKLPARRKFLRTANTEIGHITEQFSRIALANNKLEMMLIHNGRELYRLQGNQSLRQRVAELFPPEISENLIEAESDEREMHIFALLGRPSASRTSNRYQYLFLNGRFIRDKFISHAVKEAYRGSVDSDRFPVVFLFIQMPYEDYDVNVHPTKIEVRFYNANLVHSQILGCLREKLLGTDLGTPAKLPVTAATKLSAREPANARETMARSQKIADAMAEFFKKHKPIQTQQQFGPPPARPFSGPSVEGRQVAKDQVYHRQQHIATAEAKFLQIHDSFIVEQTDDGFVIVDQHALHERILYEDLSRRLSAGKLESQRLLIPESFELTDAQADVVQTHAELIEKLGIELVPFGPKTMAIHAFPTLLARAATVELVRDLIDLLTDKAAELDAERLFDEILNMAACKAAIKAGQKLSDIEIEQLLADRQRTECPGRCPHGRPTTIKFSISELEKQFKRT
jgi:DNA mismatch repair protein MutL